MQESSQRSQSQNDRKRDSFHFQIRKKQHEEIFAKKRIEIIQQNLNNVNDLLPTMSEILRNMCTQNILDERYIDRLDILLQHLRRISCKNNCREQVAQFLLGTASSIMDLLEKSQDVSNYQFITVKVRNIVHDTLSSDDDKALIPFIETIFPMTAHVYFIDLYTNLFLNQLLPDQLKEELVIRLIGLLDKNPSVFLKDHKQQVHNFYIAVRVKPKLKNSCTFDSMLAQLDGIFSILTLDNRQESDEQINQQVGHVYEILSEAFEFEMCRAGIFKLKSLKNMILNNIRCKNQFTSRSWKLIGKLFMDDEVIQQLLRDNPIIELCAGTLLEHAALGASQDRELIHSVCFVMSNYVCSPNGCRKFLENDWTQQIFLIASKFQGNFQIRRECMFVFTNLIQMIIFYYPDNESYLVRVMKDGGYEIMVEALKNSEELIMLATIRNIAKILELKIGFSLTFLHESSITARLQELEENNEQDNIRIAVHYLLEKIKEEEDSIQMKQL